ncbi:hypothetical protein LIER_38683 [Lithospermum erythrorhizon]|uniref:Uncharacterized protein n=1 Tax=Lithospermum erythrorhizon TaxID=34254 RepID=A0AAV3Q3R8_LITER
MTILDATTLAQVQLYTYVGAEIKYGDLLFTPNQDLFAHLDLKQEAHDDDVFCEIDEYPANPVASYYASFLVALNENLRAYSIFT